MKSFRDGDEALLVKTGQNRYVDVLKAIGSSVRLSTLGEDVCSIRRNKANELDRVLKKGAQSHSSMTELAQEVLGEGVEVRT